MINNGAFSDKTSKKFTRISGATYFIPVLIETGWLTYTYSAISGDTVTAQFANWSGGNHSGGGTFVILQFGLF